MSPLGSASRVEPRLPTRVCVFTLVLVCALLWHAEVRLRACALLELLATV